jgi:anti-sigma factor RsiW
MGEGHRRYEELAVGHVLGGLRDADASVFRAHLVECRDCRLRVAELRDIADELAATEREERRLAAIATRTAQAEDDEEAEPTAWWRRSAKAWSRTGVVVASVVAVVLVVSVVFWNYHLRRVTGEYARALEAQVDVLTVFTDGSPVPVDTREGVRALGAVVDDAVALSLADLPDLPTNALVVAWLFDGEEVLLRRVVGDRGLAASDDPLPLVLETGDATRLAVSVELSGELPPEAPSHRLLAEIELDPSD